MKGPDLIYLAAILESHLLRFQSEKKPVLLSSEPELPNYLAETYGGFVHQERSWGWYLTSQTKLDLWTQVKPYLRVVQDGQYLYILEKLKSRSEIATFSD